MSPSSGHAALNAGASSRSPEGTAMLAALSRKHIAMTGRLGSGPALGPQIHHHRASEWR
jgi:hypothetical protein